MWKLSEEQSYKLVTFINASMIFGTLILVILGVFAIGWMVVRLFILYPLLGLILVGIAITIISIRGIYRKLKGN